MLSSHLLSGLLAITTALAAPVESTTDGGSVCDGGSTLHDNGYTVMANVYAPGDGHQCATTHGGKKDKFAWSSKWNWQAGDDDVKSFANAYNPGNTPCKPVDDLGEIHSTWKWKYDISHPIRADVSYDMFLTTSGEGCTTEGSHDYEVMVWLAAYGGLKPIMENDIVGHFHYKGVDYDIYKGNNYPNHVNTVYSFYPKGGKSTKHFDGNLVAFLKKLRSIDGGIGGAKLQSVQAGTEAVSGSAKFAVDEYSIGH